ncbi:hypothetical protein [Coxiella-like endosymbiont]|nr:hypothetical protein [Coxiella-like endosymbiont]
MPFKGFDIWNPYEVLWLNLKGKPVVEQLHDLILLVDRAILLNLNLLNFI